jgi:septal ring factor EnvC (AmiA/AmiB activator)
MAVLFLQDQLNKKLEAAMASLKSELESEVNKRNESEKNRKALAAQIEDLKEQTDDLVRDRVT